MHYAMHCKTVKSTILELWRVSLRSITEDEMHGPDRHIRSLNRQISQKTFRSISRIIFFFFLLSSYYFFFRNITLTVSWKPWKNRKRKVGSKGRVGWRKSIKIIVSFICSLLDEYPTHRSCRLSSFEDWRRGAREAWSNCINDSRWLEKMIPISSLFFIFNFFTNIIFLSPSRFSLKKKRKKGKKTIRILEYVSSSFICTFFSLLLRLLLREKTFVIDESR